MTGQAFPTLPLIRGDQDPDSFFVDSNYGPLLFDTGAATSQLKRSALTEGLARRGRVKSRGLLGTAEQDTATVELLEVGGLSVRGLKVTLDDTHGILGADVLGNYVYTFDVERLAVTFIEPFSGGVKCRVGPRRHFFVPVEIGGRKARALLDTGASASLIDAGFYRKVFGRAAEGEHEEGTDVTGASLDSQLVSIDSLKIGEVTFPAHEFAALAFSAILPLPLRISPIAAILGATTLSVKKFSINHRGGYLMIEDYAGT